MDSGKGKTISACRLIIDRLSLYHEAVLISNVKIKGINNKTFYFSTTDELVELLRSEIKVGDRKGYVVFIDEIHVVLAELFGRTDPIFLTFLSQQRKMNINIIGTSQMYNRCPRVIRDYLRQSGQIIIAGNVLKFLQINKRLNMENVEEDSKNNLVYAGVHWEIFFHTIEMYECYDTFAIITQIQGLMKGELKNGLSIDNRPTTEIL